MPVFKIGDRVAWTKACYDSTRKGYVGTVIGVIPSDSGLDQFAIYEIRFEFGTITLHGTQIEAAPSLIQ